ncbi:MAG: hypothetical protein ACYTEG_00600 [Planctomycetota bacterium]|jgi:tetratricopeptide (TPR) repeat protein
MTARYLLLTALLACLPATAMADDLIFLTGGRVYHGTVLESTHDWIKCRAKVDGTENEYTVKREEFDPHFFYRVRDKAIGDDAKARIELAKYCVDNDMFSRAKLQMDRARAADEKLVEEFMTNEFPKIRDGLADRILDRGKRALRNGSTKNAKKYASLILTKFEGTPAEAGAEKLLDDVQAKIDAETQKKRAQRRRSQKADDERAAREVEKARDDALGPIEKMMDSASKSFTKGLKAKSVGQSQGPLESAAKKYESVMHQVDKAIKTAPDEETKKHLEEIKAEAKSNGVQAYLSLANGYSSRGTYQKATTYCNKALALDPDNAEAKQTRMTISTTTGWGGRGGGRRR